VQDRGLAAYISELIGTLFLVFVIGVVVSLFVQTDPAAQTGSDFAVVGLVHAFVLFGLIMAFGAVSGGHFNPAITVAAAAMRRIDPLDAVVYILAQLSGAVLGALLVKAILLDEGRAANYGAAAISPILAGPFAAACVEALGTFLLVLAVCAVAMNPRARQEWAPFAIGTTLGLGVMIFGPLTGGSFNPARWFGPALIGDAFNGFSDSWPYVVGPLVGAIAAFLIYRFVIAGPQYAEGAEPPTSDVRAVAQAVKDAETPARQK
jgi:glycerol uptake facilitator protein